MPPPSYTTEERVRIRPFPEITEVFANRTALDIATRQHQGLLFVLRAMAQHPFLLCSV